MLKILKKITALFIFSFVVNVCAQDKNLLNDYTSLNANYNSIKKDYLTIPLDSATYKTDRLLKEVRLKIRNRDFKNKNEQKEIFKLYTDIIIFNMGKILPRQFRYKDVISYNDTIKKYTIDPFLLGTAESITGSAYYAYNNDLVNKFIQLLKARKSFSNSNHKSAKFRKTEVSIKLIKSYNSFGLTNYFENLMPIVLQELKELKPGEKRKKLELSYQIEKIKYLILKDDKTAALKLLKKLDITVKTNLYKLISTHQNLISVNLALDKPKKALEHYNFVFNNSETEPYLNKNYYRFQKVFLIKVYSGLNKIKAAEKIFYSFEKEADEEFLKDLWVLETLCDFLKKTNNIEKTLIYQSKFIESYDSFLKIKLNVINALNAYEINFEKKIVELNAKNKLTEQANVNNVKIFNFGLITICIIFLLISLTLFNYFKNKNVRIQLKLEKSKELVAYKNNFLENISHEMRTPITIIMGYLNIVKENTLKPENVKIFSDKALNGAENLLNNLNYFLTVLKIEKTNTLTLNFEKRNFNVFVKEILTDYANIASVKNINIKLITNINKDTTITLDYDALEKVITNLLSNALKFSNSKSEIIITTLLSDNNLDIKVKDYGIGIPAGDQANVFDRFYQSQNNNNIGGFGIGLSLVKDLVNSLNGNIKLVSEEHKGSVFKINLPMQLKNIDLLISQENNIFSFNSFETFTNTSKGNLPKALIIDDNLEMVGFYKQILEGVVNYVIAFDGLEAYNSIQEKDFDIIISDYRMPKINGLELKEKLNEIEKYRDIPYILISANTNLNDSVSVYNLTDYLIKPFHKNELISRISALIDQNYHKNNLLEEHNQPLQGTYNEHFELLEKVKKLILENLENPELSILYISENLGIHEKQLNRIMKKTAGLTTVKLLIEIRIQKAYEYIVNKKYKTLSQVMFAVGFNSRTNFYDKFEKRFGIKPGELKKKYK